MSAQPTLTISRHRSAIEFRTAFNSWYNTGRHYVQGLAQPGRSPAMLALLSNILLLAALPGYPGFNSSPSQAPADAQYPRLTAFVKFWKWLVPQMRRAHFPPRGVEATTIFPIL
jgi:hypothetical protein